MIGQFKVCIFTSIVAMAGYFGTSSNLAAQRPARPTDDPILIGRICVPGNNGAERAIAELVKSGSKAVRHPRSDPHCFDSHLPSALMVPYGLEGWSIRQLTRFGVQAGPATGTAGGSGDLRLAYEPRHVLVREISPDTIEHLRSDIQCRLEELFKVHYVDVSFSRCTESMQRDGFCWWVWAGGHTRISSGFKSAALSTKISDRYWASAKLQIWMGYFPSSPFEPTLGPKVKAHFYVVSSRYARAPTTAKPEGEAYKAIDHFEKNVSPDELDDILNSRVEEIMRALPGACNRGRQ